MADDRTEVVAAERDAFRVRLEQAREDMAVQASKLAEVEAERQELERLLGQARAEKSRLRDELVESRDKAWAVACEATDAKEAIGQLREENSRLRAKLADVEQALIDYASHQMGGDSRG